MSVPNVARHAADTDRATGTVIIRSVYPAPAANPRKTANGKRQTAKKSVMQLILEKFDYLRPCLLKKFKWGDSAPLLYKWMRNGNFGRIICVSNAPNVAKSTHF